MSPPDLADVLSTLRLSTQAEEEQQQDELFLSYLDYLEQIFSTQRDPKLDEITQKRRVRKCYETVRDGIEKKVIGDVADLKARLTVAQAEAKVLEEKLKELRREKEDLRSGKEELRREKERWEERERVNQEELRREKERWEERERVNQEELRKEKERWEERERVNQEELRREKERWEERERVNQEELRREKERWEERERVNQEELRSGKEELRREKEHSEQRERKFWDDKYQLQKHIQYLETRWNATDQKNTMRSATRAANWQSTLDDKNTIDNQALSLEGVQNLSPEDQLIVEDLLNLQLKTEVAMYRPACAALRKLFGDSAPHHEDPKVDAKYTPEEEEAILEFEARPGNQDYTATVFNTHRLKFLGGHAPDITICLDSTIEPAAETTISAFELKGPRKTPFESDMCGQVFDYLIRTSTAQKGRRNVLAILSTLNKNDLFHYRTDRRLLYIYRNISLADVIRFLKFVVLQSNSWRPPPSPYSPDLGIPQQRLGQPSNSVVAKFTIPEALANNNVSFKTDSITGQTRRVFSLRPKSLTPNLMVVKRALKTPGNPQDLASAGSDIDPEEQPYDTTAVSDEIKILTHIHSLGSHDSLPHLLYHTADYRELATIPVGSHLKPRSKVSEVTDVLSDVLDALNWLHKHGIIHRDVRWDNIVTVHTSVPTRPIRGILIDLGESVQIIPPWYEFPFRGGYICCPPEVVEDPGQYLYKPKPADDLLAWVLLVNMWMFRKPWKVAFQESRKIVKKGSDENRAMEAFWTGLRTNRVWGEYYEAAVEGDIERLRGLLDVLYWV